MSGKNISQKTSDASDAVSMLQISGADADVDAQSGPQENVYLSDMCDRLRNAGSIVNEHKHWVIIALCHTKADLKHVSAKVVEDARGRRTIVRINKPKHPAFMLGNKQNVFMRMVFDKDTAPAKGASQSILRLDGATSETIVDVHFPESIQPLVQTLTEAHLSLFRASSTQCYHCGMKELLEIPNVIAFEIEAVRFVPTTSARVHGVDVDGDVSE